MNFTWAWGGSDIIFVTGMKVNWGGEECTALQMLWVGVQHGAVGDPCCLHRKSVVLLQFRSMWRYEMCFNWRAFLLISASFSLSGPEHECNAYSPMEAPPGDWDWVADGVWHPVTHSHSDISYGQNVKFMGHSTTLILMEMFRLWWSITISSVCIISCFLSEQNTSRNPPHSLDSQRKTRRGLERYKLQDNPTAHWIVITMQNFTAAPWHQPVECCLTIS